jgi:hypothetical protein
MVQQTAAVDVADVLRRQFSQRLERYRSLVAKSVETDGRLPPADADEVVQVMEQLGLPAERFEHDRVSLIRVRNLDRQLAAIVAANGKPGADVPTLEAELAQLSQEFVQVTGELKRRQADLEREISQRQRAIAAEVHRPRQSTASLDAELQRQYESNPVMFRHAVTAEELPRLLKVRQTVYGGVV